MNIPLTIAVPAALLGAVGLVTAPTPALLVCLVLGLFAGVVTWALARFAQISATPAIALRAAALTTAAALALSGSIAVLGAATLVLLAAFAAWTARAVLSEQARCAR
jgi:hypothetical protein